MMDDISPLSLSSNDCTASKARRIEGRPARALRPSSERLRRITLKRGTLAITSKVDCSSEDLFWNLRDDILEDILAKLSLFSLMAAKKVCKRWALVTSTLEFDFLRKELNHKPMLVRYDLHNPRATKRWRGGYEIRTSQFLAYNVEKYVWVILPSLQLPALQLSAPQSLSHCNYDSLTGTNDVVFFVVGLGEDKLCYKLTSSASSAGSFGETWYETPVMMFPRLYPVVSVALGIGRGHKVVVAGGGSGVIPTHRAVEVFDSEIGTWESYGDLPEAFIYFNCQTWMSGAVCNNKFYLSSFFHSENDQVNIHSLDLYTKQWACMTIQLESHKVLLYRRLMIIGTTLVVVGVYFTDDDIGQSEVTLWKVNLKTLSMIQIGSMPTKLGALFGFYQLQFLTFLSVENLVYFFSDDSSSNGKLILAEVFVEECKIFWRLLPKVQGMNLSVDSFVHFLASITSA